MGIMVYSSLLWVMQDLSHQPYHPPAVALRLAALRAVYLSIALEVPGFHHKGVDAPRRFAEEFGPPAQPTQLSQEPGHGKPTSKDAQETQLGHPESIP